MSSRLLRRAAAVAIIASGAAMASPAIAMADVYYHQQSMSAGPDGATLSVVSSVVSDNGSVTYRSVTYSAGRHGASIDRTVSGAR